MKKVVRKIDEYTTLLRDTRTGVAVVRSMRLGCEFSIHPNIDKTGSVLGMKKNGYWGKHDRVARCFGAIFDIDKVFHDGDVAGENYDDLLGHECMCAACCEKRGN